MLVNLMLTTFIPFSAHFSMKICADKFLVLTHRGAAVLYVNTCICMNVKNHLKSKVEMIHSKNVEMGHFCNVGISPLLAKLMQFLKAFQFQQNCIFSQTVILSTFSQPALLNRTQGMEISFTIILG